MVTSAPGDVIVSVSHLHKHFTTPDGQLLPVLEDINLDLREGEIVALLGKSGSGKSTLLRCIAGTLAPCSGEITVAGHRAGTRAARRAIGVTFAQERAFYLRLTGTENLLTFAMMRLPPARARAAVEQVLTELELHDVAARRVDRCSSGMVQQIAIARALLGTPSLLLLDEPTRWRMPPDSSLG